MGETVTLSYNEESIGEKSMYLDGKIFTSMVRETMWEIVEKSPEAQAWFKKKYPEAQANTFVYKSVVEGVYDVLDLPEMGFYSNWVKEKGTPLQKVLFRIHGAKKKCTVPAKILKNLLSEARRYFPDWQSIPEKEAIEGLPEKGTIHISWQ